MRGAKADYDKALWLLRRAKELADYPVLTKSGIIVGLGETNDEVVETMRDLREHDVDVVTIGQYLQPSSAPRARSTAGCTPTSSAGSGSRARRWASARSSPARSCARRTAPTSSGTRPRPAAARSRTSGRPSDETEGAARWRLLSRGSPPNCRPGGRDGQLVSPRRELSPRGVPVRVGPAELMRLKRACQEFSLRRRADAPWRGSRAPCPASPRRPRHRARPHAASDRTRPLP